MILQIRRSRKNRLAVKRLTVNHRKFEAIVHLAAALEVGESVLDRSSYYDNKVADTIRLLRTAQAAGIDKEVFSSTCDTYAIPSSITLTEAHVQSPINTYMVEASWSSSRY
jgi:UDP-glucose 4-epimerase